MVKIRLRRIGKKKYPVYKIVATDIRAPRNGVYLEALGNYNPNRGTDILDLKEERVYHWLRKGAQPTDTVRSLFRRSGLWLRWTLKKQGKDEATIQRVLERWQMQQADRPQRDADRKARRAVKKKKAAVAAAPAQEQAPAPPAQ
ncbi:MAG: 30S ribosomal protein S16 [Bacteroidota bacterium]